MMLLSFDRAVFALAESILRGQCLATDSGDSRSYDSVATFLLDQHRRMPDYLRFPFKCLTLLFDGWSLPFTGRPFHRASEEQRSRQVRAWKESRLGFRRDLIKFYEALALFAWFSERSA